MGNFRIIISAVGGHGQDRAKKNGEIVDFAKDRTEQNPSPETIIKEAVDKLVATGNQVTEATVHHWPGNDDEVVDNLLTGKRHGDF